MDEELDFGEEAPPNREDASATVDAPYGYKKDGTPAKKRGRPSGSTTSGKPDSTPRRQTVNLESQIGAAILAVNIPLSFALPKDALDMVEVQALAKALNDEANRSPRFKKMLEQFLKVQGGTSLILVIAAIAGRRVVRHNIITLPEAITPDQADALLGGFISMTTNKGPINPNLVVMPNETAKSA